MPVDMLKSPVLPENAGIRHAFFTREGGVSDGIYGSLNCGAGSDDDPEYVVENKRRAANRFGLDADSLVTLYQVHSGSAVIVSDPAALAADRPKADGMATNRPGVMLGILTADCAPVLMADTSNGVVGAAHAGWRGAVSGVIEETVRAMESLGAVRENIAAVVGPCIAQTSYQVGAEFPAPFVAEDPANTRFFLPDGEPDKHLFDLQGYVMSVLDRARLGTTGLLAGDTYAEEDLFFSYRRTCHRGEADYGRGLSAIALDG